VKTYQVSAAGLAGVGLLLSAGDGCMRQFAAVMHVLAVGIALFAAVFVQVRQQLTAGHARHAQHGNGVVFVHAADVVFDHGLILTLACVASYLSGG
jgi:hypothetical protein